MKSLEERKFSFEKKEKKMAMEFERFKFQETLKLEYFKLQHERRQKQMDFWMNILKLGILALAGYLASMMANPGFLEFLSNLKM